MFSTILLQISKFVNCFDQSCVHYTSTTVSKKERVVDKGNLEENCQIVIGK